MKYWQWSSDRSCVRITRCMSVSMSSFSAVSGTGLSSLVVRPTNLDQIHLGEGLIISGFLNIKDGNDVLVTEVSKKLHLSQGPETEHGMIKGRNLLDGYLLLGRLV